MINTTVKVRKKPFIYQICVAFCLLTLLVVCQLFQVYFFDWFKATNDNDQLFFISDQTNLFRLNSWFVNFVQQISSLQFETIKMIYYLLTTLLLLIVFIIFVVSRDKLFILFFGLILLGGLSNFISRLRTSEAVVKDYFGFRFGKFWNAIYFNLEDVMLTTAIIGIIFYLPFWTFSKGKIHHKPTVNPKQIFKPATT